MSGAKIIEGAREAVIIAPWVARVQELETALAAERQTATLNAETHTHAIRALQDMVEAEAEARREAEGEVERLRAAAEQALHEMCHTVAPRTSFTAAVDALDAALYPPPVPSSSKT